MTIEAANRLLIASLTEPYGEREAASICSLVMEEITALPKGLRILNKTEILNENQEELFRKYLGELLSNRPVQYVLGKAWFGGLPFYVDENVLIPRPETEELADWLLKEYSHATPGLSILDMGTGSGCIPVYLHSKRKDFKLAAMDISEPALEIAQKNSITHQASISFFQCDFRNPSDWETISEIDLIISNPPYIPEKQKALLDKHVRDFEPSLALFVPDEDPILFYKLIGQFGMQKLNPGGALFLEIHHDYAKNIVEWFSTNGYMLELKKDFSGNNRMIKAWRG